MKQNDYGDWWRATKLLKTDLLDVALRYQRAGLSVLPIRADGSKKPALDTWKPLQKRQPTGEELHEWFQDGQPLGLAVVAGVVSGNLAVLDVDDAQAGQAFFDALYSHHADLFYRLPCAATPSGGTHLYFRTPEPLPTQVLARDEAGNTLIEIRGEGAYAIVPPSPAEVHPDGRPYVMIRGDLADVPLLSAEEVEDLLSLARELDRKPEPHTVRVTGEAHRAGDLYNAQGDVLNLLQQHGWRLAGEGREGNLYLTRPGKARGVSASWHPQLRTFYVFTTNAHPFEAGKAYSPFACYALLEHAGDFHAAARALAKAYGLPERNGHHGDSPELPAGGVEEWLEQNGITFAQLQQLEFAPVEWCVEGIVPAVGLTLFAAKKSFGKSWALLELAINLSLGLPVWGMDVTRPRRVAYIALEDTPRRLQNRQRLASLPCSENARLFTHWLPPEQGGREALLALIRQGYEVIIIDTLSAWRSLGKVSNGRNVWQEEHNLVRELQQLALEHNVALLIAHHRRKGSAEDWVDSVAGTGGLTAPADTVIVGERTRGEADATFSVLGRDVVEQELAMQFVGNRWVYVGDAKEVAVSNERRRILDALRELGEASPREVADVSGLPYGSVKVLLRKMNHAGQVVSKNGKYATCVNPVNPVNREDRPENLQTTVNPVNRINRQTPTVNELTVNAVNAVNANTAESSSTATIQTTSVSVSVSDSESNSNGVTAELELTPPPAVDGIPDYRTAVIPLSCGVAAWCEVCQCSMLHERTRAGDWECVGCNTRRQFPPEGG